LIGPAPETVEPAPKKKSLVPRILLSLGILGVLLLGGWWLTRDDASNAKVGDCFDESVNSVALTDASDMKTVACDSSEALYKVVGIVENKRSEEATDMSVCAAFPSATSGVWIGERGEAGKVFCTEDVVQ
jgi:hypothetical protein